VSVESDPTPVRGRVLRGVRSQSDGNVTPSGLECASC